MAVEVQDFRRYLNEDRDKLVARYADVLLDLAVLAVEVADAKVAERRAEAEGFRHSAESTITGRERDARSNALDNTCEVWERQGEARAREIEGDFLRWLLDARQ